MLSAGKLTTVAKRGKNAGNFETQSGGKARENVQPMKSAVRRLIVQQAGIKFQN